MVVSVILHQECTDMTSHIKIQLAVEFGHGLPMLMVHDQVRHIKAVPSCSHDPVPHFRIFTTTGRTSPHSIIKPPNHFENIFPECHVDRKSTRLNSSH